MNEKDLARLLRQEAARQREARGDMLTYGSPDPWLGEAADLIERQSARISELEATIREQAMQYLTVSGEAEELYGERKAVVAFMRDNATQVSLEYRTALRDAAAAIERGDHQRGDSH